MYLNASNPVPRTPKKGTVGQFTQYNITELQSLPCEIQSFHKYKRSNSNILRVPLQIKTIA